MKLAITSNGNDLNAEVERQFGKAPFFLIVDTDTLKFEPIPTKLHKDKEQNEIQLAKMICNKEVNAVLTGLCNDDVFCVFRKSNIMVSETAQGNVREQVNTFIKNQIIPLQFSKNLRINHFGAVNKKKINKD